MRSEVPSRATCATSPLLLVRCYSSSARLLDRLVLGALGLLLVEVLLNVLGVNQRDDAVEAEVLLDLVVDEEGLRDWCRIGHAGRLDDDTVELERARGLALGELLEDDDQVLADGAADAAVHHLDNLLVGLHLGVLCEERVVDADLAKLCGERMETRKVR